MSGDGTYAPKSPDLSSFYSAGPTGRQPQPQPQVQPHPPSQPQQPHGQQHPQPPPSYFSHPQPQPSHQPQAYPVPVPHSHHQTQHDPRSAGYSPHSQPQQYYSPPAAAQATPHQPPGHGYAHDTYDFQAPPTYRNYYQHYGVPPHQQQASPYQQQAPPQQPQPYTQAPLYDPLAPPSRDDLSRPHVHPESQAQSRPEQHPADTMPPRRSAAAQAAQQQAQIAASPVRTKFPTARIKRIMQADEEVGKVAQQTPIAVGKALEMFMVALVSKSADVAKEKNSKRVTAQMLKQVVESDDQWDFLREIVGKVETEEKAGKAGKAKVESESEEEEEVVVEKKKTRVGRKKKA